MSKREFLQLCHKYDPGKHHVNRWYMSQKLDGMRCFYDGGITRGLALNQVPWANTEKDARYLVQPKATGLWSRYGKPIQAPDWWLDSLPEGICLDGELYAGMNSFQYVMSTVKDLKPNDQAWTTIRYYVFDSPAYNVVFAPGSLSFGHSKVKHNFNSCLDFVKQQKNLQPWCLEPKSFDKIYWFLHEKDIENELVIIHPQVHLSAITQQAHEQIKEYCDLVVKEGGEGIVLRNYNTSWEPHRSYNCLKHKPYTDDEATVVGYIWGRETDLGSKLLGKMGALIVNWQGKEFELAGFTDEERIMDIKLASSNLYQKTAYKIGCLHPGERVQNDIHNTKFPIGSKVTFRYSGRLTDDGVPKEARYHRKHEEL